MTYPEDRLAALDILLDFPIHPLEMPPDHLPTNTDAQILSLLDLGRAQAREVFEVFRVQESVRVVLLYKQTGKGLCRFGMFRGQGSDDLRNFVNTCRDRANRCNHTLMTRSELNVSVNGSQFLGVWILTSESAYWLCSASLRRPITDASPCTNT